MIINTGWLLDYLSPRCPLPDLLAALPRVGLDVEAIHILERDLASVRIGFIRSKRPLPDAPGMFVCEIEVARGDLRRIVCASAHPIEEGWGVPIALAGTELPTGVSIHEEQFHGVLSQGMICLDGELGLIAAGSGLQVFHDETLLGMSLPEAAPITEAVLHVKVYPNRPDCLGLIGIAREVAAMLDLTLVLPEARLSTSASKAAVPVEILNPSLCPRYTCQVISGVRVEKSSAWISSRLLATGSRPINNVVDISNFVMKEWGQPLHAFDLTKIREKVVVRRFKPGESLKLLDGRTITASAADEPLAIADSLAPIALAGIMGGEPTSISDTTADVLLEAAYFEPTAIRLSSRRLGVSTDSSYRFERGMDPNETLDAARDRATALLFSEAGAKSAGSVTDAYPQPVKRAVFSMPAERISSYLGIAVTRGQATSALAKLGYRCSADLNSIEVPTRRVDVNDPVVLIEDVARVIGYDAITGVASAEIPTAGATTALDSARQTVRGLLSGNGFLELRGVPLEPLEGEATFSQLKGDSITLTNPLNADLARLRRSLVPSLLKTAEHNAKRRSTTFRYFEIDKVFSRPSAEPEEHWALGLLLGGALNDSDWSTRRDVDFFDLKGVVESILETLRLPRASFQPAVLPGYAEGTAAQVIVKRTCVGLIGQLAPELLAPRKIQTAVYAAELFWAALVSEARTSAAFEALPRFPAVFRDLSFVVKTGIAYFLIEQAIRSAAGSNLETLECIDVFEGKGIAKDSRSLAVSMVFRAADRTLSSEEVTTEVDRIVARLSAEFGAELRNR